MLARKSPDAFRTISEVSDILDVPAHVLRFWESRFTQIKPVKRGGGRRYYRPQDIDLLRGIRGLLYEDGLTIKGVQKILREKGLKHVVGLGHLPALQDPVQGAPLEVKTPQPAPAPVDMPAETAPAPVERELVMAGGPDRPQTPPVVAAIPPKQPMSPIPAAQAPTPETPPAPQVQAAHSEPVHDVGRPFPTVDLPAPGIAAPSGTETQFDLFAHAEAQDRRPFPPDPARTARRDAMAGILKRLIALREKMAVEL